MDRLIENNLVQWKNSSRRKPLLIRGARQVGKTYTLKKFAEQHFNQLAYVDLEKYRDLHAVFEKDLDARRILRELELFLQIKINVQDTLIFFDEIQTCPRAIMALRYFFEEMPELAVVAAGSLLEFVLNEISFPVGRVQFMNMYPLNFVEFLKATGSQNLAEYIMQDLSKLTDEKISEAVHGKILAEVKKYFFVGGMPEAVLVFVKTNSFQECFSVHADLIQSFRDDFSKYAPRADKTCLDWVLKGVAKNVSQQIKYTKLAEGFSVPTIKKAFDLFCQARLVKKINAASPQGLPLGTCVATKRFKAILLDIGLMHQLCSMSVAEEWSSGLLSIYRGAMAEQFVGQELLSAQDGELFYWSREEKSSSAEVDFLIAKKGVIYPIEVKSGSAGRLKSLHLLIKGNPDISGIVLSEAPVSFIREQKLSFYPFYYAYKIGLRDE